MRLWRVLMSVRITCDAYDYTTALQPFYVHAPMASDASVAAIRIACAACSGRDEYRSSGTVTEVDPATLDPIDGGSRSRSWDDGTHAAGDVTQSWDHLTPHGRSVRS